MARNNRRTRGGRRGGNRGLIVREAPYSLPVPEPCNFMETSVHVNQALTSTGVHPITWGDIAQSIMNTIVNGFAASGDFFARKLRITSMVVEPFHLIGGSGGNSLQQTPDCIGVISGNHWSSADTQKQLRMRFSKDQGSDGEWKSNVQIGFSGGSITVSGMDGFGRDLVATDAAFTLDPDVFETDAILSGDVRFRIAWTDATAAEVN